MLCEVKMELRSFTISCLKCRKAKIINLQFDGKILKLKCLECGNKEIFEGEEES